MLISFLLLINQVCIDGFILLGVKDSFPPPFFVAPYFSVSLYHVGKVSYEVHTTTTSMSLLSKVNSLIDEHMQTQFSGEWMLVAEWKDVVPSNFYEFSLLRYVSIVNIFIYN